MKAYKITDRNLKSLTIPNSPGGVQYGIGQAAVPNVGCGPLTAFKSLADVRLFKRFNGWRGAPVFECKVVSDRGSKSLWYYVAYYPSTSHYLTPDISPTPDIFPSKIEFLHPLPEGTILCKKITLIREVH